MLYKKLGLTDFEYEYIKKLLKREPNKLEIFMFSAMHSEHCGYKHSKKLLSLLPKDGSIYSDENAGGIRIGDKAVLFKMESHNHPSAVEPFNGAATGIGGIIRDVLALNARPVALLNSLKFGNLNKKRNKYLLEGVVNGISSYGNSIGVPTLAGEVAFDNSYDDNPLVNVMAVGIADLNDIKLSSAKPNLKIVLVGSKTGTDGIGGASFASKELDDKNENKLSIQIADPFMKKRLIEATLEILNDDNVFACQDCGAAGVLSSTSEMGYKGNCGVELYMNKVHTRQKLEPWQILLSESQERMVFLANDKGVEKIDLISEKYEVEYSVIGKTIEEKEYRVFKNNKLLSSMPIDVLAQAPFYDLAEIKPEYIDNFKDVPTGKNTKEEILELLKNPNFVSKKWVYSQYDFKVGNRTVLSPDDKNSAVLWIYEDDKKIGLTIDSQPLKVYLNPYEGTIFSIYESYRNLVSNGIKPLGITNCLNFGNPEKSEVAYQFINTIKGMKKACETLNIPVVSGNVSFYNESDKNKVYPTPTIGMIGICENKIIKSTFDKDTYVYLLGQQISEKTPIGGSLYQKILFDFEGGEVDKVHFEKEKKLAEAIENLNSKNLIKSCIDVSIGGVFIALLKALSYSKLGFEGKLISTKDILKSLFGEVNCQYLVSASNKEPLEKYLISNSVEFSYLGRCIGDKIKIDGFEFSKNDIFEIYNNTLEKIVNDFS